MGKSSEQKICNLAGECVKAGNLSEAASTLERASVSNPLSFQIHFELGNVYRQSADYKKAALSYRKAVDIKPDFFAAYFNLGSSLKMLGKFKDAIEVLNKAKSLCPDIIDTYLNLASIFNLLKDYNAAVEILEVGVKAKPARIEYYLILSESYVGMHDYDAAELTLQKALVIIPDSVFALNEIGNIYMLRNDLNSAKDYYCRALKIKPDFSSSHYNLAGIMRKWNRLDDAMFFYTSALKYNPGNRKSLNDIGECCLAMGEIESAEKIFSDLLKNNPADTIAADNLLLSMNYNPVYNSIQLFNKHREVVGHNNKLLTKNQKKEKNRFLRVGYLSPDFCKHPSASILLPIFRYHNPEQIQHFGYSQTVHYDEITDSFKSLAFGWRTIERLSDEDVCELIKKDRIDILVDCAGHMSGNRLGVFNLKPAPLQITGVGYPNTTGMQSIDYRITDIITDPLGEQTCHTEELLRLGSGFCCYEPLRNAPVISDMSYGNDAGVITFGSTHTPSRLNKQVIKLWSELLNMIPESRLLIFRNTLCKSIVDRLTKWFVEFGVDPLRIEFKNAVPDGGHLEIYRSIDITLDTSPWSGHVTACESLQMGVPVITLRGNRHAGRMVSSILYRAGLPELIADSVQDYLRIAKKMTDNPEMLSTYKATLKYQFLSSPVCDCKGFVKSLENAYFTIWYKYLKTE